MDADIVSCSVHHALGALQHLGLSSDEIDNIFRVTAAVLHLGDIQFKALGRIRDNDHVVHCLTCAPPFR